jgi:hypothetical protein
LVLLDQAAKIRAIEYDGELRIPLGEIQTWLKPKLMG